MALWGAFVLVHLILGLLNLYAPTLPMGDVTLVYRKWVDEAVGGGSWVVLDKAWVYPVLALVPMLFAGVFGLGGYAGTWLSMVMLLNAAALGILTGWGRSRERIGVAWWWLAFTLALGPIALARIDSVTVPLLIVGVLLLAARPKLAAVLLTIGAWTKIWPAAIVAAALIALKDRWRILGVGALVSAVIVAVALALGSGARVFSFVTEQTGRGLQVEAPVTTIWLWRAIAGVLGTRVYYDRDILTYQVRGIGTEAAANVMTPLLAIAVLAVAVLGIRAVRAGASAGALLPPLALALVTTFIAVNKVGSPQFIAWISVPIVLGLATAAAGHGGSFRRPAILALVIAALTQLIYPHLYDLLLDLNPVMVSVLTVRNILEFVLLGWAVVAVVRSPRFADSRYPDGAPERTWLPAVWPFAPRQPRPKADAESTPAQPAAETLEV